MKKFLLSIITITTFSFGAKAQNVTIPDPAFKTNLLGNTLINTDNDPNEISLAEASAFTGRIDCRNLGITDLTGIEEFTSLTELWCFGNLLTSLDVSNNTSLTELWCFQNSLTSLDVSNNTSLTDLNCASNSLTSLDVSNSTSLTDLNCSSNSLTILDVSNNTSLTSLRCDNNSLSNLDVSNNTSLILLWCQGNFLSNLDVANGNNSNMTLLAGNNPDLTCITVDDVNYSMANWDWMNIDVAVASFSPSCIVLVSSITTQGQGGASTITTNATLQMEATVLPANATDGTYTWSVADSTGSATISASGLLTAVADGIVTVTATVNDGSGITGDAIITISNQTVGLAEFETKKIGVYPNPASTQLRIENEDLEIIDVSILNITGKTVKTTTSSNNIIDVSDLTKGIYFLKIQTDKGLVSKKFIKE